MGSRANNTRKVDRLLAVCKMNDYEHNDLYIPILERWSKGDFSNAVDDHNKIWKLQHGGGEEALGKATRLSTPEEEGYYIKEYFENKNREIFYLSAIFNLLS